MPESFEVEGMIRCQVQGEEALLTVPGVTPELLKCIEEDWHASIEVRDLTTEDIFLEMHHA